MGTIAERIGYERSYVLAATISTPYVGVVYDAVAGKVKLPTAEGQEIIGVIQAAGVAGEAVSVAMGEGVTRVAPASGATWAVGANLMVETGTGLFKEWTSGSSHVRVARAEDALASGNTYGLAALRFGGEMDTAAAVTIAGDITLENGEVISNATNGQIDIESPALAFIGGTTGGLVLKAAEATATLSGASTDIAVNVPTGCKLVGAQLRVDTLITAVTGVSWSAAYKTGNAVSIATGQAFTKNTKVNTFYYADATDITTGTTVIAITPNDGTFSAGVIRAIVYYYAFEAMANAA